MTNSQDFTGADLLAAITRWHNTGSALDADQCSACGENPIDYTAPNGLCADCGDDETIADDNPIWAERDALMFPAVDAVTVNDGAPYMAGTGYRYSQWPRTASFFASQITESASAMRPVPTLCHAVCPTHHWSCAAELPHGNGAHVCNSGGQPHHFFTRKQ